MLECNKNCLFFNENKDNGFEKWIVQLLGPVLLGEKPAEIVSFPKKDNLELRRIKDIFSKCNKVSYKEFVAFNGCKKILFYNNKLLDSTLLDLRNLVFLKKLGYGEEYSLDNYLGHLIKKMEKDGIPHEIGIFLGYPLKDVIGFMGHPSLKLTKINGWNVYGDSRLSDEKYVKFNNAKQQIRKMLEKNSPEMIVQSA